MDHQPPSDRWMLVLLALLVFVSSTSAAPASNETTTLQPVTTDSSLPTATPTATPDAPKSDGPDVRSIRFALLGAAIGLVGCGACVLFACWVHKNRTVPGADVEVPTAATLDEERARMKAKKEQRQRDDRMAFGPGTRVRGKHMVELKEHWDAKNRDAAERKRQAAADDRPVNAYGEFEDPSDDVPAPDAGLVAPRTNRPSAAGADAASSQASPVNPIDRFRNGDAVASYRTHPGPHAMPWEGESRVGADGVPIVVVEAADVDSPDRYLVGTEFSRQSRSAPANTQFTAPGASAAAGDDSEPFVVTMADKEDAVPGDGADHSPHRQPKHGKRSKPPKGLLAHVRQFFINEPEVDSEFDPRFVRPEPDEVFKGLAKRDEALAAGTRATGSRRPSVAHRSKLEREVEQHEMTEAAYAENTAVDELCAGWLEAVEAPKLDPKVAMKNVNAWCHDLPPSPAGVEGEAAFAANRTGRWVEEQRPGPYELPPQSRSAYTPPSVTPPNATTPRTPMARSGGATPRPGSGVGDPLEKPQPHIPIALRLTAEHLKLPPKRDSLGRLMAP